MDNVFRFELTKDDVERCYAELDRRLDNEIMWGILGADEDTRGCKDSMLQGMYGTLMMLASNWKQVLSWIEEIEDVRYWKSLGYNDEQDT